MKIKRYLSIILMLIVGFVLQTTIFGYLELANVRPNILIVITAASGFMFGRRYGMLAGGISGLLMDLMYSDIIGISILIYVFIGYVDGIIKQFYFKDDLSIPLTLIGISDLTYGILFYIMSFMLRGRLGLFTYLKQVMLPEVIYTVFIGLFIYKFMHWLDSKLYPPVEVPLE
ncbi:MAG: rod shape-determining protein MreD [Lachnospiraceae bacterium]|nr:rod shape-determining protein MreD [Lachnospiraceae bacterium]